MQTLLYHIRALVPKPLFKPYHYILAVLGALLYQFPSRDIFVVGVTGTKGKTSVVELTGAILEEAGYSVALTNTIRFKIGNKSSKNLFKMTMPGRFFIQRFLRNAVRNKCDYAVIEMTSEGTKQFRHCFIDLDALIFTNLSLEHIESHGSYEKYRDAKLKIAHALEKSNKKKKIIIANKDDKESERFLNIRVDDKQTFGKEDGAPSHVSPETILFTFDGEKITAPLGGSFNLLNMLAALTFSNSQGIETKVAKRALENFSGIPGRMEKITLSSGQAIPFDVYVDYAHTTDSLENVYETFGERKKICVLGGTGGGRDTWKRKEMGSIANTHCEKIILTNEDPYNEDPEQIVREVQSGISSGKSEIILNRREAIRKALTLADQGDVVLITGKGTDPYIMGPQGTKEKWSDAEVIKEELAKMSNKHYNNEK